MLKPYEGYRVLNISWLDEVPSHWECKRINAIFSENKEINSKLDSIDAFQFNFGELVRKRKYEITEELAKTYSKYTLIQPQDVIINGLNLNYDFLTQRVALVQEKGIITSAYISLRPRGNINSKYFAFLLKSLDSRNIFNGMGSGIRLTLDYSELKKLIVPIPTREEQDQIVKYLDWQTSRINNLIKAKKKQIELLREKIFTEATISSVDYVSNIKLKRIVSYPRKWVYRNNDVLYRPIGVLNRGRGVFEKQITKGCDLGNSDFFEIEENCLILSGQFAWEGSVALTNSQHIGCIASHRYYTIIGCKEVCLTEYLWAFFRTQLGDLLLNKCSHGAAGRNKPLNFNELLNEYIPLPEISIQQTIARDVKVLFKLINEQNQFELLLSEYKASLISSVVTGRVDVRDVIVPNFEAVEEVSNDIQNDIEDTEI